VKWLNLENPILLDGGVLIIKYLKWKQILSLVFLTIIIAGVFYRSEVRAESDGFPVYPSIQPNVAFWTKIYTQFTSNQGVIHDKRNMNRIYGVIELVCVDDPGARKTNRQRIKKAKIKYKTILAKFMRGNPPFGPAENQVAALFGPDSRPTDFRSAMRNIRCQIGQKDRFRAGVIRSGAYIDEIKQIFHDAGLPEDLTYLPHVESSFNPRAYSKFGAAGIWQFTRSTGKNYMRVGYTIDERRDPILSSFAAAKFLHHNYRKLKTWPMAITAYNHGAAGMLRAQRSHGNYEAIFKRYRSRIFRFASRNFYSEFLAARDAAENYRQYFGDLKLDTPVKSREIVLTGYASLPDVVRHLKVSIAELRNLNPALRHPVFLGQKYIPRGYRLRLPEKNDEGFEILTVRLPDKLYRHHQKRSQIYTVRKGDTAGKIARIHGVKLNDLVAANNLGARATIYINQNIKIPLPDEKTVRSDLRNTNPLKKTNDLLIKVQPVKKPLEPNPMLAFMLAQDAGAHSWLPEPLPAVTSELSGPVGEKPVQQLVGTIDLGQLKQVKYEPQMKPEIVQGHFAVERVWEQQQGIPVGTIRVDAEETLGHYAEWLNVQAREIRRLNGFRHGRSLHLSQQIKIPLHRTTKDEFEEKRFEYHKELAEDFFASYRVGKVFTYSIKRGDSIWSLCRQEFEVPLWLLKRYNADVDFNALIPSQQLLIPVVEKNT
jgi:membrane-bound lytic murein transglycosylase D